MIFCLIVDGMKASKLLDGSCEFALTYEDKDGDWMLVGDVPWGYVCVSLFLICRVNIFSS